MPRYKLSYFNIRGLAEPARMMLALGGGEYVDERFTHEEWPQRKNDKTAFPLGQVPVLVVDDTVVIPQTKAICRYLATELNFFGSSSLEGAQIDVILETLGDIEKKLAPIITNQDVAKMVEMVKEFIDTTSKPYFSYLEQLIKDAGGKNFIGNKISLADIQVFHTIDMLTNSRYKIEGVLDAYPQLMAFFKFFREGPLKTYLESRPVTDA